MRPPISTVAACNFSGGGGQVDADTVLELSSWPMESSASLASGG